jgi:hypothetical protein
VATSAGGVSLVVYGTAGGDVVAVRSLDGSEAWRVAAGGPVVSVVADAGLVFVATDVGDVVGFDVQAAAAVQRFRSAGLGVAGGATRLAVQEGVLVVVTPSGGLRFLTTAGATATVRQRDGSGYAHATTAAPGVASPPCAPCAPAIVTGNASTRPGGVIVGMGSTILLWNIDVNCAPATLDLGAANERVVGHVVVSHARASAVTTTGDLVRVAYSGDCNGDGGVRRLAGSFVTEPLAYETPTIPDTTTYVIADRTGRIHNFRLEGNDPPANSTAAWPASLPAGRTTTVTPALDNARGVVVVDNAGDVHAFTAAAVRRLIGSAGAAPTVGPLLVGGAVVVSTTAGELVALEGGPQPATFDGWTRDSGNPGGASSSLCASSSPAAALPVVVLGVLLALPAPSRRRRTRR